MSQKRNQDEQVRELFRLARKIDRTESPSFKSMLRSQPSGRSPRNAPRAAFVLAAGAAALAWVSVTLVRESADPIRTAQYQQPPTEVQDVEEPPRPVDVPLSIVYQEPVKLAVTKSRPLAAAPPPPPAVVEYFQTVVSGVSNVDPLTGQWPRGRALGGLARIQTLEAIAAELESPAFNTEAYDLIEENEFLTVAQNPLSTFSIDVDTASYANVRRFLNNGQLPPKDAVRIEELINYFDYDYPEPLGDAPFSTHVEVTDCPWMPEHRLVRIGLRGIESSRHELAGSNLVFLIDVSGSMSTANKLPLVKKAMRLLVDQLDGRDRVAMVVYAGASGLVLPSTSGDERRRIVKALGDLRSGGGTNGGAGLELAYKVARENFIPGGVNRVILATDGDFNLGITNQGRLLELIEKDARKGIFLTALGVGMGNFKDDTLEMLSGKGNGNYAYIDTLNEARKVLVEEIGATLVTIAKDVKIQVEFNPAQVGAYRLLGYENRMLRKEDFNDDRKDAGEIGAGHTVTALYELVPPGKERLLPQVDPLKYQDPAAPSGAGVGDELLTVKLRYKDPESDSSRLLSFPVTDPGHGLAVASVDLKFAVAVAEFGMLLKESPHRSQATLRQVHELAFEGAGPDAFGYRKEFLELVERARKLMRERKDD